MLVVLAFLFTIFSLSQTHVCRHDKQNISLSYMETPFQNHFQQISEDYQNIRIHFDFSNWFLGSDSLKNHLQTMIIPPVQNLLQAALKVRPSATNLFPTSTICDGVLYISNETLFSGYDADIVLFVSTTYNQYDGYIASAGACTLNPSDNRPVFGVIEYNTFFFAESTSDAEIESNIYVTLHELTHALGFSSSLYKYYIDPITRKTLTNPLTTKIVNGANVSVLNITSLTNRLRTYFNCPTLEGAYLENQGSVGSAGSHFERRIFYNEYMTASRIKDARFTEFSLAVLEGTGWYQVDYSYAEPMTYGKNQGCDFLDTTCVNTQTKTAAFKEFCSPLSSEAVSWTKRAYGVCGIKTITAGNSSVLPSYMDYWDNFTMVQDQFSDNCPKVEIFTNRDCEDIKSQSSALIKDYEFYGFGGKAFAGTLNSGSALSATYGYCFKTQCAAQTGGDYQLYVLFGNKSIVTCTNEAQVDPPSGLGLKGKLFCPDATAFCNQVLSEGYCKGSCFGVGKCVNRECVCNDGWTSYNCAKKQYVDNCVRCANGNVNKTSCYGNECVCNPSNKTCNSTGVDLISDGNTNGQKGYSMIEILGIVACWMIVACVGFFGGRYINEKKKSTKNSGADGQNLKQSLGIDLQTVQKSEA